MKRLILEPIGWPCSLEECPPGHFLYRDMIGFKSEYHQSDGEPKAFCDSGEYFVTPEATVQPLIYRWEEYES